jgi:predicted homoserine dehydrogenase-like protein
MVEVVSSLRRDGTPIADDLRWGVYAVFEGDSDYARRCFAEYGVTTDPSGRYAALWRPTHFIGLELGVSVASVALRREPTGVADAWRADAVAVAKRALRAGEVLDGEGGGTVWGRCIPADRSRALEALPIGLSHGVRVLRDVAAGAVLSRADVALDPADPAVAIRAEMQAAFA